MLSKQRLSVAVVGTGIAGLSAAWLLGGRHDVTLFERSDRIGGHCNTVDVPAAGRKVPVDTGFIVFNRHTYPNFAALLDLLKVPTRLSDMSFAVSMDAGDFEYSGSSLAGVLGQPRNLLRRRFWSMLADLVRFYRHARADAGDCIAPDISLGEYLLRGGYGSAFREDHLLPMASAIWSAAPADMLSYPAAAFIRFHHNHGLLQFHDRPVWETVAGGSRAYVERLTASLAGCVRLDSSIREVRRVDGGAVIIDAEGRAERFDHVVIAAHADQALAMLADASVAERQLLAPFRYSRNLAVLHSDESFMPRRRAVWSSWNCIGERAAASDRVCVTYWMNRLQALDCERPLFVTLNPPRPPRAGSLLHSEVYEHPVLDAAAMAAQQGLWSLQGARNTWFCGSYFGAGFHEDALQSGLAVAEQLGGVRRPWRVVDESGRINITARTAAASARPVLI